MKRTCSVLLLVCLLVGLLAGCGQQTQTAEETPEPQAAQPIEQSEPAALRFAESYKDVYASIEKAQNAMNSYYLYDSVNMRADAEMPAAAEESIADSAKGQDVYFSGTNVQVAGVDEGDIVKTDGTYFYILRDVELIIMKPEGKDVKDVSHTIVGKSWEQVDGDNGAFISSEKCPMYLYISGDRAVVISSNYHWTTFKNGDSDGTNYTAVDIYDLGDRTAPKLVKSLGQDGYSIDSRLIDGKLYVCTAYYVDSGDEKDPVTYVPRLYTDGKAEAVPCGTIGILNRDDSQTYAVLTGYDLDEASVVSTQSVLGGGDTLYMNTENLFLCRGIYEDIAGEATKDDPYDVTEHRTGVNTTIHRFAIDDGSISYQATGTVPGRLNNQFSLDEHNGYLRLATTEDNGGYRLYVDPKHKFENYEPMEQNRSNDVFVLDKNLETVGSIRDIAPEESVFSARFDGDYGYLCTYRTVDPIFAVNLTDPAAPTIVGELSLSGYSDYLHMWTDHQLFGLGMQTQEIESEEGITARLDGMKMVMIDTSDPAALKEENTQLIDADYSQALNNHKAILVSQQRDLIGFPAEGSYLIYGYSDDQGFQLKKEITFQGEWDWQSRGVYIGDFFYVIGTDYISSIDLNTLENVGMTVISRG